MLNNSFSAKAQGRNVLKIGDLVLDRSSLAASLRAIRLPLHPIQVRILELLMLSPGRVFTRREILNNTCSHDQFIDDRTIDVTIGRIRSALRHKVSVDPIRTVRGVGYAFNEHFGRTPSLPKKGRIMRSARQIKLFCRVPVRRVGEGPLFARCGVTPMVVARRIAPIPQVKYRPRFCFRRWD